MQVTKTIPQPGLYESSPLSESRSKPPGAIAPKRSFCREVLNDLLDTPPLRQRSQSTRLISEPQGLEIISDVRQNINPLTDSLDEQAFKEQLELNLYDYEDAPAMQARGPISTSALYTAWAGLIDTTGSLRESVSSSLDPTGFMNWIFIIFRSIDSKVAHTGLLDLHQRLRQATVAWTNYLRAGANIGLLQKLKANALSETVKERLSRTLDEQLIAQDKYRRSIPSLFLLDTNVLQKQFGWVRDVVGNTFNSANTVISTANTLDILTTTGGAGKLEGAAAGLNFAVSHIAGALTMLSAVCHLGQGILELRDKKLRAAQLEDWKIRDADALLSVGKGNDTINAIADLREAVRNFEVHALDYLHMAGGVRTGYGAVSGALGISLVVLASLGSAFAVPTAGVSLAMTILAGFYVLSVGVRVALQDKHNRDFLKQRAAFQHAWQLLLVQKPDDQQTGQLPRLLASMAQQAVLPEQIVDELWTHRHNNDEPLRNYLLAIGVPAWLPESVINATSKEEAKQFIPQLAHALVAEYRPPTDEPAMVHLARALASQVAEIRVSAGFRLFF
ncbi:hypothetical protein AWB78_08393 [Caballeronia calidae]|uniref:Uncharacterized protein n=1 Tax=Caballeronia calidae TaxID=1777139 RepID=A0A158EKZ9_9BURK|nr:hypothetical protein [Caballeronia calidae]SAL07056.1 hypothetical protein AWB78_08393 [Caballeronia calidae]